MFIDVTGSILQLNYIHVSMLHFSGPTITDFFEISSSTGELRSSVTFDREETSQYILTIEAEDQGVPDRLFTQISKNVKLILCIHLICIVIYILESFTIH